MERLLEQQKCNGPVLVFWELKWTGLVLATCFTWGNGFISLVYKKNVFSRSLPSTSAASLHWKKEATRRQDVLLLLTC
jgi:hypothetical protein